MNVVALQVFVSLVLVAGSLVLFVHSVRQRDHEHADRLSLAPLESDLDMAPALQEGKQEKRNEVPGPQIGKASKETVCRRDG
ncbi:MAG TPA: hypothetical protein VGG33_04475 [Polyangia bacterium]